MPAIATEPWVACGNLDADIQGVQKKQTTTNAEAKWAKESLTHVGLDATLPTVR